MHTVKDFDTSAMLQVSEESGLPSTQMSALLRIQSNMDAWPELTVAITPPLSFASTSPQFHHVRHALVMQQMQGIDNI